MAEIAIFTVQFALNIALPWWVVQRDLKRLSPEALDRSWNTASFWAAVVGFGLVCIPVHFTKVRRSFWGFLLGMSWMAGTIAIILLASWAMELVFGF